MSSELPERGEKKRTYKWLIRLAGVALFAYILLFRIELSGLGSLLSKLRILPLLLAIVLAIPVIFIKASRWRILLGDMAPPLSSKRAFSLYAVGLFAGHATPGQLGEFSKALFMKKLGYTYHTSIISILFDRIFDLFILLLLALIGAVIFRELLVGQIAIFIFSFAAISLLLLLVANPKIRSYLMSRLGTGLLPAKLKEAVRSSSFWQRTANLSLKINTLLKSLLFSLLAFSLAFLRYYLLILSLNISLSFWYFVASVAIASVVSFIPISFAGIGTRDATLIYLFGYLGLGQEEAVSFSLLILFLLFVNMSIGFFCWLTLSSREIEEK